MINKVKKINKKYILLFLIFALLLITPFTYSRYTSKYTKHIFISATNVGYKVEFNANGGEGTMETQAFILGVAQKLKENEFTKPGHIFLNWNTKADGTGTSYEDQQEVSDLTNQNGEVITLYATYCLEKFTKFGEITFNGQNSDNPYLDTGIYLFNDANINKDFEVSFEVISRGENKSYESGDYPTIMNAMDESGTPWPGMVYRVFNDWDDQLIFNVSGSHKFDNAYHPSSPQKVTLKRINGAIYLNLNNTNDVQLIDASGMTDTFNVPVGFGAGLDENGNQQRWFKGTLSNIKVVVKEPNTEIGIINFFPNHDNLYSLAQHVKPNETYSLMENPFVREGYIFTGWNTSPDGSGTSYENQQQIDAATNLVSSGGKVNLYAQWRKYNYTVVFHSNNGEDKTVQQEFVSATPTQLTPNSFTKEGYSFAFWTTGENGSGNAYQDGQTVDNIGTENQVVNLYANYETFSYQASELVFDGTDYINTHIYLFSEKNVGKDFQISFKIDNYVNTRDYNTIISSLDESGTPYPGFVFRINDSTEIDDSSQKYNFEVNSIKPREKNLFYPLETKEVSIRRTGGILYLKLDTNAEEQIIDYSTLTKHFYYPVTVGASLDVNFNPWREFHGTIRDVSITLSQ